MKMYLVIIILIILVVVFGYIFFHYADILLSPVTQQPPAQAGIPESQVCFGQQCFSVQLAKTSAEQEKGLMFVKQLDQNSGMLFIFNKESIYSFWMKNTLIPLDMIWMDGNNKVVYIADSVQPCKTVICPIIMPKGPAKYVLEINSGISKNLGIKVGDVAQINIK
jgi:hypothetical protein